MALIERWGELGKPFADEVSLYDMTGFYFNPGEEVTHEEIALLAARTNADPGSDAFRAAQDALAGLKPEIYPPYSELY